MYSHLYCVSWIFFSDLVILLYLFATVCKQFSTLSCFMKSTHHGHITRGKVKIYKLIGKSFSLSTSQPNGLHRKESENVVFCWFLRGYCWSSYRPVTDCWETKISFSTKIGSHDSVSLAVPTARCHFASRIDIPPLCRHSATCLRVSSVAPDRSWTLPGSSATRWEGNQTSEQNPTAISVTTDALFFPPVPQISITTWKTRGARLRYPL